MSSGTPCKRTQPVCVRREPLHPSLLSLSASCLAVATPNGNRSFPDATSFVEVTLMVEVLTSVTTGLWSVKRPPIFVAIIGVGHDTPRSVDDTTRDIATVSPPLMDAYNYQRIYVLQLGNHLVIRGSLRLVLTTMIKEWARISCSSKSWVTVRP